MNRSSGKELITLWVAICLIATFAIITDTYNQANFPGFERARPGKISQYSSFSRVTNNSLAGAAYILGTLAWITAVLLTFGVTVTGTAASMGHRWAAGNRAYTPIEG